MTARVLIVEDDEAVRDALVQSLDLAGMRVDVAADVDAAEQMLARRLPDVVLSDIRMPGRDGFALLASALALDADLPVVMLTGHADVPMAVRAMAEGAYDFLEKPSPPQRLLAVLNRAIEKRRLVLELRNLRAEVAGNGLVLGHSPASEKFRARLNAVAATDVDVLLIGETGVGKEVTARALHAASNRRTGPFVAVNCGALPQELAESELFGHEAGAFTGAAKKRIGKFEFANGGTLFLDEIESMPMHLQVKLLRVLQERECERLGSNTPVPLDVRVIAATKRDLKQMADAGQFRADLYFRLDVARLRIPALRERAEDIPLLFAHFVAQQLRGATPPKLTAAHAARLMAQPWPGNVRELKNAATRFALGLGEEAEVATSTVGRLTEAVETFEAGLIRAALADHGGRVTDACAALGVPRKTFYDKLRKYDLRAEDFRESG